mgnify:CR=1 FL=1
MKFGQVQHQVLGEGIHLIIPIVNTVKKIGGRIKKQTTSAETASKYLLFLWMLHLIGILN